MVIGGVGWLAGVRWPQISAAIEGRVLFAPAAEIEGYGTRDKYDFAFGAISVSGCLYPWGTWAFVCIKSEVGALLSNFNNSSGWLTTSRLGFVGAGLRLGGERVLTRGLALRAYAEVLAVPLSGSLGLESDGVVHTLWPGSVVSSSLGIGPVLYFD